MTFGLFNWNLEKFLYTNYSKITYLQIQSRKNVVVVYMAVIRRINDASDTDQLIYMCFCINPATR